MNGRKTRVNGELFHEFRMRAGLTISELAAKCVYTESDGVERHVNDQTIVAIENGRRHDLSDKIIFAVAKGLGMDAVDFEKTFIEKVGNEAKTST